MFLEQCSIWRMFLHTSLIQKIEAILRASHFLFYFFQQTSNYLSTEDED